MGILILAENLICSFFFSIFEIILNRSSTLEKVCNCLCIWVKIRPIINHIFKIHKICFFFLHLADTCTNLPTKILNQFLKFKNYFKATLDISLESSLLVFVEVQSGHLFLLKCYKLLILMKISRVTEYNKQWLNYKKSSK